MGNLTIFQCSDPEGLSTVKGQPIEFTSTPYQDRRKQNKINLAQRKALLFSLRLTNYFRRKFLYLIEMNNGSLYLLYS